MKVNRSYLFRFYPTVLQIALLAIEFGNARWVWNWALREKINNHQAIKLYPKICEELSMFNQDMPDAIVPLNFGQINRELTRKKQIPAYAWLKNGSSSALTQKLRDLDTAYQNFFTGRAKFPRFKKKEHAQSIRVQMDQRIIGNIYQAGALLKAPKLGALKIKWSRMPVGTPKMLTIKKNGDGKYFVSFSCEEEQQPWTQTGKTGGIDLGIGDTVVDQDNGRSGAPKYFYLYQRQLRRAQRILSRRTKGSARWQKQRILVAKLHAKVAQSRRDFQQKLSTCLIQKYDVLGVEDLWVKGMLQNRKLSKALSDASLGELVRQLEYKALWYGKTLVFISRFYPSTKTCSACGALHKMALSQRRMQCACGTDLDRDHNAAINIHREALSV